MSFLTGRAEMINQTKPRGTHAYVDEFLLDLNQLREFSIVLGDGPGQVGRLQKSRRGDHHHLLKLSHWDRGGQ